MGLSGETETKLRELFPEEIGVLVVDAVVPEGPAYRLLEEGDILVSMNGEYITKFVPFEDMLDNHVDKEITVRIERGGKPIEFKIHVGDLHAM